MTYSALKGMQDILPPESALWQQVEQAALRVFRLYGYQEIRLPILESTDLFVRSIGETTDIVEKEMYTFQDKAGRSVTLRPEGTASAVRAFIEHGMQGLPQPQKLFYCGPMFRYERPQKGRFRQFHQIGAEALGIAQPSIDAEIIALLRTLLHEAGLRELAFELNSIGCEACRPGYRGALLAFFEGRLPGFCPDCQRRYTTNPLRILDCKVDRCVELRTGAPVITAFLCSDCREHSDGLISRLRALGVGYTLNPSLVRGLDYYTRTAFEVTSEHLGAQKAVAAGGRYDRLVGEFGGPPTPAIGFAIGMERLVTLLRDRTDLKQPSPRVFIATLGDEAEIEGLRLAESLRTEGVWAEPHYGGASLKSQLRRADKLGADYALIIGGDELKTRSLKWKNLKDGAQGEVAIGEAVRFFVNRPSAA